MEYGNTNSVGVSSELQRIQMLKAVKNQFYIHKSFDAQSDLEFLPAIAHEYDSSVRKNGNLTGLGNVMSPSAHYANPYHQVNSQNIAFNDLMKIPKANNSPRPSYMGNGIGNMNGNLMTNGYTNSGFRSPTVSNSIINIRKKVTNSPGQYANNDHYMPQNRAVAPKGRNF